MQGAEGAEAALEVEAAAEAQVVEGVTKASGVHQDERKKAVTASVERGEATEEPRMVASCEAEAHDGVAEEEADTCAVVADVG